MATTVDELEVRITAEMAGLRRALDQAERRTKNASRKMEASFVGVGAAVGKLTALIGALGLGALATSSIRATAEMENLEIAMSSVFGGIEQGKSAVKFIQDFATKTPFDIQTLSRAFIQLGGAGVRPTEKLLTTLGDAASATVNELQTFEALTSVITKGLAGGLGLEEFQQLVTAGIPIFKILEEQLGITRQEVSDLGQSAEGAQQMIDALLKGLDENFGGAMEARSAALSTSLSNLGIAANNALIEIGKGGLRSAVQELSESMSSTMNQNQALLRGIGRGLGNAALAAGRAVAFLGENLKTIAGIMAVTAGAGATLALARAILNLGQAFALLGSIVRKHPLAIFALAVGLAATQIEGLKEKVDELGTTVMKHVGELFPEPSAEELKAFEDMELSMQTLENQMAASAAAGGLFKDSISKMSNELQVVNAQIAGMNEELAKTLSEEGIDPNKYITAQGELRVDATTTEGARVLELLQAQDKLSGQTQQLQRIQRGQQAVEERGVSTKKKLQMAIGEVEQALAHNAVNADDAARAIASLEREIALLDPVTAGMTEAFEKAGDALGDSLTNAIEQGKISLGSFRNMVKRVALDLLNEYLKLQVFKPLFSGIGNIFSSAFGLPSAPTPEQAGGGSTRVGVPTLVGERGPELFVPSAGRIMNAQDTRKAMGGSQGVAIVQNFNLSAGVVPTVRNEVENMMPVIQARTISAVKEGQRRG